ncbi:hypothetical protein DH2020_048473 [Rehmannia glutinosa]|uniref:Uncharacterized protein n=1 Tax=Rehmannia glutinosa TaxID=99300 RepID=A0ABR0U5M6_REHGL
MKSESSLWRRRVVARFTAGLAVIFLLLIIGVYTGQCSLNTNTVEYMHIFCVRSVSPKKEEGKENGNGNEKGVEPNRIWSDKCSKSDIVISQGPTEPLPNGIPTYTVEIIHPPQLRLVQLRSARQPSCLQAAPLRRLPC